MKLLKGHTSESTAYLVENYPYGFGLRCQVKYWLETNGKKGTRMITQTSNPKRLGIWNKPKASIYARFGMAMYLNDVGHVQTAHLTEYMNAREVTDWVATYGDGVPEEGKRRMEEWLKVKTQFSKHLGNGETMEKSDVTRNS